MFCNFTHFMAIIGLEQPTQASNKLAHCTLNDMFCLDSNGQYVWIQGIIMKIFVFSEEVAFKIAVIITR